MSLFLRPKASDPMWLKVADFVWSIWIFGTAVGCIVMTFVCHHQGRLNEATFYAVIVAWFLIMRLPEGK